MAFARQPRGLSDALIFFGALEDRAAIHLPDQLALNLLPRGLRCGISENAGLGEILPPLLQLLRIDQYIDRTAAEVDADPVAGTQQREAAAHRRFGRGVQDRRRTRRARLTTVADAGQRADAFAAQIGGRAHRSEEHTSELPSLMRISYAV